MAGDDEREVLAANAAFYEAFAAHDIARMGELWARNVPVAVIHPGWPALHGREPVLESWSGIFEGPEPPTISCSDATAVVLGSAAFVVCTEQLPGGSLVATNVFAREDGAWRMVLHQAGPAPTEPVAPPDTVH
ncbi:MAG: nuclear transport factor 2 family protein [Myxococcota bacterium]|nr:nuclear transport factor 2 family protein [Myxococcota bacterium]